MNASAQWAFIALSLLTMAYGCLCVWYGMRDWPVRARWAVNGAVVALIGWCAFVLGVFLAACV